MDKVEESTRLIEVTVDEFLAGICVTWRVSDAAAAVLRAEIIAVITRAVIDAELWQSRVIED